MQHFWMTPLKASTAVAEAHSAKIHQGDQGYIRKFKGN